jgi:glycosyltransferase involved in cell wall biosynthesis
VEGFGISAIEASARGKPVVVSDQGGMPETIIEGRTGFSVSPDDTARVADLLGTLAADPSVRRRIGEAGRVFARAEFTPRASAERLHSRMVPALPGANRSDR